MTGIGPGLDTLMGITKVKAKRYAADSKGKKKMIKFNPAPAVHHSHSRLASRLRLGSFADMPLDADVDGY